MRVAIIDYESGNLRSAAKAFERAVADSGRTGAVEVTRDPAALAAATHIVLPGVGAFADCKSGLAAVDGMQDALSEQVRGQGKPFLGICVGMQLMASWGREHGDTEGFGWIPGDVAALEPADKALKIPHMGWNALEFEPGVHPVLDGISPGAHTYFVHSYGFAPEAESDVLARVDYAGPVTAIVGRGNLVGTQFHPEKSQRVGLKFIANFLRWSP